MVKKDRKQRRMRRKLHIKKNVQGTILKPRIFVFKSNKYFYAGLADDDNSKVIKSLMAKKNSSDIITMASAFAKVATKYETLVFDRSGYRYHGLVKTFADELRNKGVKI
ncbi:MAG: 50S ribosomal protein L18 [Candidatus Dojkabacteria bacterium]